MKASVICFECTKTLEYLLLKLNQQGFSVEDCIIIPQKRDKLEQTFKKATSESDIVFYLGGLGWSQYDILKDFLTESLNVHSVYTRKSQEYFNNYVKISGVSLPPAFAQEKLLSYPEGFEVFPAVYGYEMAAIGKFGATEFVLLPENYEECVNVYDTYLEKRLKNAFKNAPTVRCFKVFGLTASEIEGRLKDIKRICGNLTVALKTDEALDASVTLSFPPLTRQSTIDKALPAVYDIFANEMYCDGNFKLPEVALHFLKIHNRKLAVAESLTGGLISSELVSAEGAGESFQEAFVTYSNESKQTRLLVKTQTLAVKGAVSSETAYEMAIGLLNAARCDTVLAITGIAGPSGGSAAKPVGRTYIALGDNRGIHVYEYTFNGSRNKIRLTAAKTALFLLIKFLKKIR